MNSDASGTLSPHLVPNADGVVNNFSGPVAGNVMQARDVHGGISFEQTEPRNPPGEVLTIARPGRLGAPSS
jgi:hypothetical protein